ncbi:hypothetical protein [uncultured Zobellia sp.]|uniref:hypothetical protein n=1 Tax=uncultured Zobellia sp. TaxID=255433 RepID=UPI00259A9591|nr:hypothetical protein [uncultured Zobellia sp.]
MKIAILGAGTYGSYTVDSLQRKFPQAEITIFDVGDSKVKSEDETGFFSQTKRSKYKGLTHGRFFGWGGASHKWGGQLLTFTENDFAHPCQFMKDIIGLDKKYKDQFLAKFKLENKFPEKRLSSTLFTKTGVWLSMLHRNFFKWFKIDQRQNVKVLSHCRIVKLLSKNNREINGVVYLEDGIEKTATFDYYFLTAGAFENARILLSSEMVPDKKVMFSDHLSQKMFKVKGSTVIGSQDYVFKMRRTSLITKRMVGEIDDISYYIHPVFNMKFPFFVMIKEILYFHKFSFGKIGQYLLTTLKDIPHVLGFIWSVVVRRKIYVMNKEWFLYIDIENPTKDSYVSLSNEKDKFGLSGLDVYYNVGKDAIAIYEKAQQEAVAYLNSCKVNYEIIADKIDVETCEDIYHPYGMIHFDSMEDYFTRWSNLLVISTGILPRSGGINPTAAVFPLIDEFVNNRLKTA